MEARRLELHDIGLIRVKQGVIKDKSAEITSITAFYKTDMEII